jgi:hypothetical protein
MVHAKISPETGLEWGTRFPPTSMDGLICEELRLLAQLMDEHLTSGARTGPMRLEAREFLREKLHQEIVEREHGPEYSWVGIVGGCYIISHKGED